MVEQEKDLLSKALFMPQRVLFYCSTALFGKNP
jgi:hypothetical protein